MHLDTYWVAFFPNFQSIKVLKEERRNYYQVNDARSRQPDRYENGDELGQSETPV